MTDSTLTTQCCIVGGGPAGMMLGFLLARAGVDVVVLEKWPDFFRDFRGDTIHPSTMELMHELGLLSDFLKLPHNKVTQLKGKIGNEEIIIADFSRLKVRCPFIAFMPQWDFLNFLASHAKQLPNFHLLMQTEAVDLINEGNQVVGAIAQSGDKTFSIRSQLVVGADGRHSMVRKKSHLISESLGAPIDVLWFRLTRKNSDPKQALGRIDFGRMMVMLDRGDYWQCGYLIRKGGFDSIRSKGLDVFRDDIVAMMPVLADRVHELQSWDEIKLLTVMVDRLKQWYLPGLLCIGDSAHAMSPIGGVGINLAIQDAVAAANILKEPLLNHMLNVDDLSAVQKRRELPTKLIQRLQVFIQNRVINRVLGKALHPKIPFPLKLLQKVPFMRHLTAYLIGVGIRSERIR